MNRRRKQIFNVVLMCEGRIYEVDSQDFINMLAENGIDVNDTTGIANKWVEKHPELIEEIAISEREIDFIA